MFQFLIQRCSIKSLFCHFTLTLDSCNCSKHSFVIFHSELSVVALSFKQLFKSHCLDINMTWSLIFIKKSDTNKCKIVSLTPVFNWHFVTVIASLCSICRSKALCNILAKHCNKIFCFFFYFCCNKTGAAMKFKLNFKHCFILLFCFITNMLADFYSVTWTRHD